MPLRVELIADAVDDLARYAESGNLPLFLKKLIRLEEVGQDAGIPLGGGLTGWRKIVVGDRDWRIIFTTDSANTVATVWAIGDRSDAACYDDAVRRVQELASMQPHAASLAAVMFQLSQMRLAAHKGRRSRR